MSPLLLPQSCAPTNKPVLNSAAVLFCCPWLLSSFLDLNHIPSHQHHLILLFHRPHHCPRDISGPTVSWSTLSRAACPPSTCTRTVASANIWIPLDRRARLTDKKPRDTPIHFSTPCGSLSTRPSPGECRAVETGHVRESLSRCEVGGKQEPKALATARK